VWWAGAPRGDQTELNVEAARGKGRGLDFDARPDAGSNASADTTADHGASAGGDPAGALADRSSADAGTTPVSTATGICAASASATTRRLHA
jgi:hypothetical protein